jgi:plastocyanin
MRRSIATLITCSGLLLGSGCGSSVHPAPGSTAGAPPAASTAPGGSLKASTTPRFASPPASAPVHSGVVQIAYRNITIAPDTVKVKVGSSIVWTNYDAVAHNVTSRGGPVRFASANFGEGKSFRVAVTKPGVIHYLCTIHPTSMNGTIEVVR